jgi:hypothetical protein
MRRGGLPRVSSRAGGWAGLAFVVVLLIVGGMVSLPTTAKSGEQIKAFYAAHASLVVAQQVLGLFAAVLFAAFATGLAAGRRRWLLVGTALVVITEIATNIPPVILALGNLAPDAAHSLTLVEDLADAALFASIGVFSVVATIDQVAWVQAAGLVVAGLSLVRAVLSPVGVTALDYLAPSAFLALVLILSVRLLIRGR